MHREWILTDFLSLLLKKLRVILLTGVVAAAVLGGLRFTQLYYDAQQMNQSDEQQVVLDQKNLLNAQRELTDLQNSYEFCKNYILDSVYFNLNPYKISTKEIVFSIETDYKIVPSQYYQTPDQTIKFVNAYGNAYKDIALYNQLQRQLDTPIDVRYIGELISVTTNAQGIVALKALHENQAVADAMADTLFDFLYQKVSEALGEHQVVVITELSAVQVDNGLVALHKTKIEEQNLLQQSITDKEKQIEDLQVKMQQPKNHTFSNFLKGSAKYALFGGVLGCGIAYFLLFLAYLTSPRLNSSRDVEAHYIIPLLVQLHSGRKKRKRLFEAMIRYLDGESPLDSNPDNSIRLVDAAIQELTQAEGLTVLVTGTCDSDSLEKITEQLTSVSSGRLLYVWAPCVLSTPETYHAIQQADSIVLVEKSQQSNIKLVDRQILCIERSNTPIIGMILQV